MSSCGVWGEHTHKHFKVRENSRLFRFMKIPIRRVPFSVAEKSRWVYGADNLDAKVWTLTVLGVLHSLFGLTMVVEPTAAGERKRIADWLTNQATYRFSTHGVHDERGAALWDAAAALYDGEMGSKLDG